MQEVYLHFFIKKCRLCEIYIWRNWAQRSLYSSHFILDSIFIKTIFIVYLRRFGISKSTKFETPSMTKFAFGNAASDQYLLRNKFTPRWTPQLIWHLSVHRFHFLFQVFKFYETLSLVLFTFEIHHFTIVSKRRHQSSLGKP